MRIKRIEAASVAEAMRELRRELGDHALILHTRQIAPRGVTGWFRAPRVEILGAVDEPELMTGSPVTRRGRLGGAPLTPRNDRGALGAALTSVVRSEAAPAPQAEAVPDAVGPARAPEPGDGSLRPRRARRARKSTSGDTLLDGLRFASLDWTPAVRRARRLAFVGPTGGGKTTTLAKLAARAQLDHHRRVGLITIDTYRIGAVPQLRAYAKILGVPLEVAHTPDELSHALIELGGHDIVFIDTIGRSPLGGGVDGLVPFLATAAADEVYLVLSATTRPADSIHAARSFARLAPNRLVVTKIDETDDHTAIGEVARATGLPLAWLGVGQEVPDDLEEATPPRLGALLAGCPA